MSNGDEASGFLPERKLSFSDENFTSMPNLRGMNLTEKILFVIDTAREKNCTPFKLSTGASYTPLFMIKRIVECFVCIKSIIQHSHEYASMILNSRNARWVCDFTNNANSIVNHLNLIDDDVLEEDERSYDLGQLFDKIQQKLHLTTNKRDVAVPSFVVRVILVYSRSNVAPTFQTGKGSLDALTRNPHFFLDVLYVHEPPCLGNVCEEIYSEIATLDTTNCSYILEVGRNAAKLHDNMAKLLAHPLQRPPQNDACYSIYPSVGSEETYNSV